MSCVATHFSLINNHAGSLYNVAGICRHQTVTNMAEGGADADKEPEYPDYKSWEELYKNDNLNYLIDGLNLYSYKQATENKGNPNCNMAEGGYNEEELAEYFRGLTIGDVQSLKDSLKFILQNNTNNLNCLIDGFNLYKYKQANKGNTANEGKEIPGEKYHITLCNTAAEGEYYIRKEKKKPTIYFILFKNHPDDIFKGTDYRPCKVGYTGNRNKKYDRTRDIAYKTSKKIKENKKYKMRNKCEFEVIKLPISATSTESFYETETTIREMFGEKLSGEETEKKIIELFGKSIDKTKDEKKEIEVTR